MWMCLIFIDTFRNDKWFLMGIYQVYRKLLRKLKQTKAKITNNRFSCMALTGKSDYNICINCDMTVSCNCNDNDGSGHIGDLYQNDLGEIFKGSIACKFREMLCNGILPIMNCTTCKELQLIPHAKADYFLNNFSVPQSGLMIENTVKCNLACRSCDRNIIKTRKKARLDLADLDIIGKNLKKYRVRKVVYHNLGEPFFSSNILDELKILRKLNPEMMIRLSTNGIKLKGKEKFEAALLLDDIVFSIDGVTDDMVRKYQKGGSFKKAYQNMKALVKYRNEKRLKKPTIRWQYILFNWNDRKKYINTAKMLAQEAKVDKIYFIPTFSPFYGISWRYFIRKAANTLSLYGANT